MERGERGKRSARHLGKERERNEREAAGYCQHAVGVRDAGYPPSETPLAALASIALSVGPSRDK